MDCRMRGSCVHEISQARTLEWIATSLSRGSSRSRYQSHTTCKSSALQEDSLLLSHRPGLPALALACSQVSSEMQCRGFGVRALTLGSNFGSVTLWLIYISLFTLKVNYLFPLSPSFPTKMKIIITNF